MNPVERQEFGEAVSMAQSGQKEEAYERLLALSKATGAKDPYLLLWIAFTTPDLAEAETCIQMAETKIPNDPAILNAYNWLRAEKVERAKPKVSSVISPAYAQQVAASNPPIQQATVPPPPQSVQPDQPVFYYVPPTAAPEPPVQVAQAPVYNPEPAAPPPVTPQVVRKKRSYKRLLVVSVLVLLILALGTVGVIFFAIPFIRGPEYTQYQTVATMVDLAAPRDLVKFYAKLTFNQMLTTEEYDYYAWYTNTDEGKPIVTTNVNINPRTVRAVFVRFPRDNPDLRPSDRYTYYYARVLQQGYEGQSLLVEIQKVDYKDKADLVPVYPLIQGRALRTIRAQELPNMGKSPQPGYLWISTDVEILVPKDDPNVKSGSLESNIRSSRLYLESTDAQYTGSYSPQRIDIGNLRSEGDYLVIPATIVILGPPDWKSLEWVVVVSQREIRVPLKL
jgi:hypothetical protein